MVVCMLSLVSVDVMVMSSAYEVSCSGASGCGMCDVSLILRSVDVCSLNLVHDLLYLKKCNLL